MRRRPSPFLSFLSLRKPAKYGRTVGELCGCKHVASQPRSRRRTRGGGVGRAPGGRGCRGPEESSGGRGVELSASLRAHDSMACFVCTCVGRLVIALARS